MTTKGANKKDLERSERTSRDLMEYIDAPQLPPEQAAVADTKRVMERHRSELRKALKKLTTDDDDQAAKSA
jgi:hypothetical protein